MASKETKAIKTKLFWIKLISFVLSAVPLIACALIAIFNPAVQNLGKIIVIALLVIALITYVYNYFVNKLNTQGKKRRLHCTSWLILLGLYIAVKTWLLPVLIILAVVAFLDDFLFMPLVIEYESRLERSKQTDDIVNRLEN